MSGQPYRYASDVGKFRDEYMASLGLRTDLDDLNLQANKTYKQTGALPPVSQMKDNRTTSEILADTEKLKQGLMEDLKLLGSASFTSGIIQRIINSKLNRDGSFLIFVAQRAPEIVRNLQKMYKYGIKGDTNDIEKFVEFIEDMFSKTKTMSESVKTYFNRPASTPGAGMLSGVIKEGDVDTLKTLFDEISRKLYLKVQGIKPIEGYADSKGRTYTQGIIERIKNISVGLQHLKEFLSSEQYKLYSEEYMGQILKSNFDNVIVNEFFDLYKEYVTVIEQFPKADILFTLLKQLDTSLKNTNMKLSSDILDEIEDQFASMEQLERIIREMEERINYIDIDVKPVQAYGDPKREEFIRNKEAINSKLGIGDVEKGNIFTGELERRYTVMKDTEKDINEREQQIKNITEDINNISERLTYFNQYILRKGISDKEKQRRIKQIEQLEQTREMLQEQIKDIQDEIKIFQEYEKSVTGHGIKKRRGRPRGSGIAKPYKEFVKASTANSGIMESPRFVHFGKYLLNMHKLNNEGIFSLKQPSGGNIIGNPSIKISKNLSGVIKKMVGGSVPTYNELSQLSEPEKVYLHKVSKKSNIEDKFSIPTPSKDAEEKDMHQFEVMKGEIMSGNDNKDFIKKFKLLIMKLSKNGSLPKSEVNEILGDLAELGY